MEEPYEILGANVGEDIYKENIYKKSTIDEMLEDDELSFEEAAFMTGYCDFA